MRWITHIALAGLIGNTGFAALADGWAADGVRTVLSGTRAPGVAVGVLRDGRVEIAVGGFRIAGQEVAVGADDLWHIGSNAKAMTATLVARLVEAGEISWDDTVGEVLGDSIPAMEDVYREATYVDLLSHRARLPANIGRMAALRLGGALAERDIRADRLVYAGAALTGAPEAEGFLYSNAGYVIVGAMLEAEMDAPWEELIRTHVAAPLGMTSVGFGAPGTPGVADQPRGHQPGLFGRLKPVEPGPDADNIPAMGPAGTLHLSPADMMRFLGAHAGEDRAFLGTDSWDVLHRPRPGADYVQGWRVEDGCLAHNGSNTLWFARMVICPDDGRAGFVAVNLGDFEALRDPLAVVVFVLLSD